MSELKILIVEDEAIVADDLADRLEAMGYAVVGIEASGEAAIETVAREMPDIVLMDIMLQGHMDGIEAAQQIGERFHLPVVYLTANADRATLDRAKLTVPLGYILKPFKDRELQVTLEIALTRHNAEREIQQALAATQAQQDAVKEESDRKSQYFSMASHEFRTPLSVIQASAEMLDTLGESWSAEKKKKYLQRIQSSAASMNQLLEDVLAFGRVQSDRLSLNRAPLNLVVFCEELVESFTISSNEQYCLRFHVRGCPEKIYADDRLLWHALSNLLSNAIKYSPKGGSIDLNLCEDENGDLVRIEVRDSGIGIASEDRPKLFEPFHRASNVGSIPGTGLGLAIVKRAIDLHGGTIEVRSQVGFGTTFIVCLPISPPAEG